MKPAPDHICPRCGGDVPAPGVKGQYPGALSRTDNNTEICSACGTDEAMEQFTGLVTPQNEWGAALGRQHAAGQTYHVEGPAARWFDTSR